MDILSGLEQVILYGVLVLNAMLAVFVYRHNHKSATNIIFVFLSLTISLWLAMIRESGIPRTPDLVLNYTRLTVFLAVPQSVLFFLLAHTLPSEVILLRKKTRVLLLIATVLMMGFTLTPYVFKEVQIIGEHVKSVPGAGIPLFALFTCSFSIAAIYVLIKKIKRSKGNAKQQLSYMMRGIISMLGLIITTIMLPIILFQNQSFLPLSPLYALVFLGMTAYAIVKFQLFDLKTIATEVFTSALWIVLLAKAIVNESRVGTVIDLLAFLVAVGVGIFLIRSVRQEVRQREQLQKLTIELARANEQLKALDKARVEFISIASHQLRTPPSTIKWYTASLLGGDFGPISTKVRAALKRMQGTNNSMIALIDDLLNASRIERGKMEFLFESVNLLGLVRSTIDDLVPQAEDKNLSLVFIEPKTKIPNITADKQKIRQVVNNFIDNAIKYTKQGKITVELYTNKEEMIFKVTDAGKGIDLLQLHAIFDKYNRGRDSVTHATGLGLGLYVAKVIVEQHKGKIWAESTGLDKGSTFYFSLPLKSDLKSSGFWDLTEKKIKV